MFGVLYLDANSDYSAMVVGTLDVGVESCSVSQVLLSWFR